VVLLIIVFVCHNLLLLALLVKGGNVLNPKPAAGVNDLIEGQGEEKLLVIAGRVADK
jgi:hypothetical protein